MSALVFSTNDIVSLIAKCYIKHPKDFATLMLVCKGYDRKYIFSILLENLVINHFNYYIVCKFLHRGISFASLSPHTLEKLVLKDYYPIVFLLLKYGVSFNCCIQPHILSQLTEKKQYGMIQLLTQ